MSDQIEDELNIFNEVMADAKIKVHLYDELPDAIDYALTKIKKNDVLLLAGCQGMDFGCNIVIDKIEALRPELDREKLRSPLKHRVAGLLEGEE